MLPLRIEGETRRVGDAQEEYIGLSIKDSVTDGINFMQSNWEVTPHEMTLLSAGGGFLLTMETQMGDAAIAKKKPNVFELIALSNGMPVNIHIVGVVHPPIKPIVLCAEDYAKLPQVEERALVTIQHWVGENEYA